MRYVASEVPTKMDIPAFIAAMGRAQEQVQILALKHRMIIPGRIVSDFKLNGKTNH